MKPKNNHIAKLAGYLRANPDDIFSKFALALELLKVNEVSKARILFESVLEQDPGYLGVYYHLGRLYEQIGLFSDAKKIYETGIILAGKQNNEKTRIELTEALEILHTETEHDS